MLTRGCLLLLIATLVPAGLHAAQTVTRSRARVARSSFRGGTMTTVVGRVEKQLVEQKQGSAEPSPAPSAAGSGAARQTEEPPATTPVQQVTPPGPVYRVFKKCQEGPDARNPDCMSRPKSLRQKQWEQFQRRHGR